MTRENVKRVVKNNSNDILYNLYDEAFMRSLSAFLKETPDSLYAAYPILLKVFFQSLTNKILNSKVSVTTLVLDVHVEQKNSKLHYLHTLGFYCDMGTLLLQKIYHKELSLEVSIISKEVRMSEETIFSLISIILGFVVDNIEQLSLYRITDDIFLTNFITISHRSSFLQEDGTALSDVSIQKKYFKFSPKILSSFLIVLALAYYIRLNKDILSSYNDDIVGDTPLDDSSIEKNINNSPVNEVVFVK